MPLVSLFAWLLILALLVILVRVFLPERAQPIKNIIVVTLAIVAVLIVLSAFGVIDALQGIRTPRI